MEPAARIEAYFLACSEGSAEEIANHFTDDAVIYDTNIRPMETSEVIGRSWVKVRERWQGARWTVDTVVSGVAAGSGVAASSGNRVAAIEWSMTGTDPDRNQSFAFRGSEHYRFADADRDNGLIAEIRQYWTFDPDKLDTALQGYPYPVQP